MAVTHKLIETKTVSSSTAASIEFTSIPQTYTDLILYVSARTDQSATTSNLLMQFNSDTGSNYYSRNLWGNGSTATVDNSLGSAYVYAGPVLNASTSTSSVFGSTSIYIPNYTGGSYKSLSIDGVSDDNATTRYTVFTASLWQSTSAITSIKIYSGGSANLVQYSSVSLYGIKNS